MDTSDVGYESTSVETSEWVSVQLDKVATGTNCPDKVYVVLERSDKTWSSGKTEIDTKGNVIEANLKEGMANSFSILAYDEQGTNLECFPNEITIIQGSKVGAAPLPYFIGIEMWDDEKKKLVFEPIEGLEKNKPLPATGVLNASKTSSQLRPGNSDDKLVIPIYQADEFEQGASSKLYEYVADIIIDGSDVDNLIPESTPVDLTIKADYSEIMTLEAYFPSIDITVSKELKADKKQNLAETPKIISDNFAEAERTIKKLEKEGVDVSDLRTKLEEVKKENENNTESKMVLQHQKEVMREIEKRDSGSEFDRLEKELKRVFKMTEEDQKKYGNFQTGQTLDQLRPIVDEAIAKRDVKMAKDVLEQVRDLDYELALVEYFVAWILGWNKRFETLAWKDKTRARQLINQAIAIINDSPTADKLRPFIKQLVDLLPDADVPAGASGRLTKG